MARQSSNADNLGAPNVAPNAGEHAQNPQEAQTAPARQPDDNNNNSGNDTQRQQNMSSTAGAHDQGSSTSATNDVITRAAEMIRQLREGQLGLSRITEASTQPQTSTTVQPQAATSMLSQTTAPQADGNQHLQQQINLLQQQLENLIQQQQAGDTGQSDHSSGRGWSAATSSSVRKPKLQRPEAFDGSAEELRYWVVEFDEWLDNEGVHDTRERASYLYSYMKGRIKRRLTTLKINDPEDPIFGNYALLRRWLLDHYGPANADVTAAQRMHDLRQRYDQPLQDFINDFETIMADLDWNDAALSDAFSRKLTSRIIREVHQGYFSHPPASYTEWKRAAQQAELHINETRRRTERSPRGRRGRSYQGRAQDNRSRSPHTEGGLESQPRGRGQDRRRPFQPTRGNKKYALSEDEWKRRRNEGLCLRCGEKGHWEKQCLKAFLPPETSTTKN